MARLRGSPKNMKQGQYWVRRHLDDQKRSGRRRAPEIVTYEVPVAKPGDTASGLLWVFGSLLGAFAVLFVIAGFITGWQGFWETTKATFALIVVLIIGFGVFGSRH